MRNWAPTLLSLNALCPPLAFGAGASATSTAANRSLQQDINICPPLRGMLVCLHDRKQEQDRLSAPWALKLLRPPTQQLAPCEKLSTQCEARWRMLEMLMGLKLLRTLQQIAAIADGGSTHVSNVSILRAMLLLILGAQMSRKLLPSGSWHCHCRSDGCNLCSEQTNVVVFYIGADKSATTTTIAEGCEC